MTVRARHIAYAAGEVRVLDDVSIAAERGSVVAIAGPNGAGKSTTLDVLAGDLEPDSGSVQLGGREVSAMSTQERAAARAALSQFERHDIPFAVRTVVEMGRRASVSTARQDATIVTDALTLLDLHHIADRSFSTLSGGEQQRVHLARVLAQNTPVLLLDEPTESLDVGHQRLVASALRRLAAEGRTVVAVVHDLNLAARYADQLIILARGAVVADGPPSHALDEGLLSAVYEHPIRVVRHPFLGGPLVVPVEPD